MLDETNCRFRGFSSILSLLPYFGWKILLANNVDPDQMPHDVASDLGPPLFAYVFFMDCQVRMG